MKFTKNGWELSYQYLKYNGYRQAAIEGYKDPSEKMKELGFTIVKTNCISNDGATWLFQVEPNNIPLPSYITEY